MVGCSFSLFVEVFVGSDPLGGGSLLDDNFGLVLKSEGCLLIFFPGILVLVVFLNIYFSNKAL